MTTKEQERKALEQIKKIVENLGYDSYVAAAFEGCFEIAETNIENDWACSMKQRAESAEKKVEKLELDNRDLRNSVKVAKENASKKITDLEEKVRELSEKKLSDDDLTDCKQLIDNEVYEADRKRTAAANDIVLYAEATDSKEFQKAVRDHRNETKRREYLIGLSSRIEKAIITK